MERLHVVGWRDGEEMSVMGGVVDFAAAEEMQRWGLSGQGIWKVLRVGLDHDFENILSV